MTADSLNFLSSKDSAEHSNVVKLASQFDGDCSDKQKLALGYKVVNHKLNIVFFHVAFT